MSLKRFLTHGYFPYELPQSFSSVSYGEAIDDFARTNTFPRELLSNQRMSKFKAAQMAKHNLARPNKFRRTLGIPNPIIYMNLCKEIIENWTTIEQHISQSPLSQSKPTLSNTSNRAFRYSSLLPNRPQLRAHYRSNGKYLLKTDIQNFYPSIYTHSLPWALHTKQDAKLNRYNFSYLGNRLDKWSRLMQDDQTMGVPLGPDSSRILSEIVLATVDTELHNHLPTVQGFRLVDDYELTFKTRSEAESALSILQAILSDFELSLNEVKTEILELPLPLEDTWIFIFRNFQFSESRSARIQHLTSYFGLAFETALKHPQSSVISYAISRLKNEIFSDGLTWAYYQDLLIQSMIAEPGSIRYIASEFKKYKDLNFSLNQDKIQDALEQIIECHYLLGHGSEIAWAIWTAILLEIPLSSASCNKISQINEPLVPLLALHAQSLNLTSTPLDLNYWSFLMTKEELWGSNWLLCYEANIKGWLPSLNRVDHVAQDPCFSILKNKGVSFYDVNAVRIDHPQWKSNFSIADLVGYTAEPKAP